MARKVFFLFSFIMILLFVQSYGKLLSFSDNQKISPFEPIKDLQGSQKGVKVKSLNEIIKYLHDFGYLSDSYKVQRHGQDEDISDDVLGSAIKTYQINFNLNATGTLNAATVSQMTLPRCGVPDIVNGENWMRPGKDKRRQDYHGPNKKVHMVSHYKIINGRRKWPSSSISYGINNTIVNVEFVNAIKRAFNEWANATSRFTFNNVQNFARANIKISVYTGDHGDGAPFDGEGNVTAHAFGPTNGRLHFDGDEIFATSASPPGPNELHLESLALHEIGHTLGLNHTSINDAVMWPFLNPGETKAKLTKDDLDGITCLYGNKCV